MEVYKGIIEVIDVHLTYALIPILLTLIVVELLFKNRFETKTVLNLVRWTILVYAVFTWIITVSGITLYPEKSAFLNRATGPYAIAYWIMFLNATILPFTLLVRKLASKFWYVLLVAFCMKIGFYFERFVIITTSFQTDYADSNGNAEIRGSMAFGMALSFLQGILIAIVILGMLEIIKRKKRAAKQRKMNA